MDQTIQELIESMLVSGKRIFFAYELPDGRVSAVTNGDTVFMNKLRSTMINWGKTPSEHDVAKSEARRARDEGIAGNKGNVGDKGNGPVPGYNYEINEDLEVEKKFTIN